MNPISKEIIAFMEERDKTLKCTDFMKTVAVNHQDGSHFLFQNAIVQQKKFVEMEILLVWTEHCGCHFFFLDDLSDWCILKRT